MERECWRSRVLFEEQDEAYAIFAVVCASATLRSDFETVRDADHVPSRAGAGIHRSGGVSSIGHSEHCNVIL